MCKAGHHLIALGMNNAMKVVACRLINYSGHSGSKTDLRSKKPKTGSENRKNIFKAKLLTISVMVHTNKPENVGLFPGTKSKSFFVA